MNAQDRALCQTFTALLRASRVWAPVAWFAAACAGLMLVVLPLRGWALLVALAVLGLSLLERWLSFRLRLDETLFTALAQGLELPDLDRALQDLGLRRSEAVERSLAERWRGVLRWLRWYASTLVLLSVLTALLLLSAVRYG